MVVLRVHGNGKREGRNKNMNMNINQKASLSKVEQMGRKKGAFGSTAGSNMLGWLKGLALDPCEPEASRDSIQKIRNQTLKLRKVWRSDNAERNQRKRRLEQFLRGGNFTKASDLAPQNSNELNVKKLSCKQKCFVVMNSYGSDSVLTFSSTCNPKRQCTDSSASDNAKNRSPYNKDVSFSIDTEESIISSDPLRSENLIFQDPTLEDCSDLISSSNSSSSEKKLHPAAKSLMTESKGENRPRAVIPIGPKFQAEIPEWMGPINKDNLCGCNGDSDSLKWLGTKIWPIRERSNTKNTSKLIGRGRPDSCSCASPGSIDCIQCHMLSARLDLQSNLGPAFLSWKFDEMGEVVAKAWTLKEQHMFESFAKTNSPSNKTDFWKAISNLFPSKSSESILSYYYNVSIPRRMREQTGSSFNEVDSDENKIDDDDDEGKGDDGGDAELSTVDKSF